MQFRHVSVNRNFSETWSFGSFSSLKSIKQRTFIHCYRLNYVEMHQIQTEQTFVIGTDRLKDIPGTLMACFKSIETWSRNKFLIKNLTFSVERNIHKFVISNNLLLIENEKNLFSLFLRKFNRFFLARIRFFRVFFSLNKTPALGISLKKKLKIL